MTQQFRSQLCTQENGNRRSKEYTQLLREQPKSGPNPSAHQAIHDPQKVVCPHVGYDLATKRKDRHLLQQEQI